MYRVESESLLLNVQQYLSIQQLKAGHPIMTSSSDLAVAICHGSYHTPAPYMPLVEAFKSRGIDARCPQLPTADLTKLNVGDINNPDFDREPPEGGYPQGEEDAQVVLGLLEQLISDSGKSRLPMNEAAVERFDLPARPSRRPFDKRQVSGRIPVS